MSLTEISSASMIQVQYTHNQEDAELIKKLIIERRKVPSRLVRTKFVTKCRQTDERLLELCLNEKGDLIEIPNINSKRIKQSFLVFIGQKV